MMMRQSLKILTFACALLPAVAQADPQGDAPLLVETAPTAPMPPPAAPAGSDPALDAEGFDTLTRGRTFDTHDAQSGLYGVETFYPDRQVVWKDAEGCMKGTWAAEGEQICFTYEGGQNNPVCWTYHARGDWMMGWFRGDRQTVPIMLYPSKGPEVSCGEFLGS